MHCSLKSSICQLKSYTDQFRQDEKMWVWTIPHLFFTFWSLTTSYERKNSGRIVPRRNVRTAKGTWRKVLATKLQRLLGRNILPRNVLRRRVLEPFPSLNVRSVGLSHINSIRALQRVKAAFTSFDLHFQSHVHATGGWNCARFLHFAASNWQPRWPTTEVNSISSFVSQSNACVPAFHVPREMYIQPTWGSALTTTLRMSFTTLTLIHQADGRSCVCPCIQQIRTNTARVIAAQRHCWFIAFCAQTDPHSGRCVRLGSLLTFTHADACILDRREGLLPSMIFVTPNKCDCFSVYCFNSVACRKKPSSEWRDCSCCFCPSQTVAFMHLSGGQNCAHSCNVKNRAYTHLSKWWWSCWMEWRYQR